MASPATNRVLGVDVRWFPTCIGLRRRIESSAYFCPYAQEVSAEATDTVVTMVIDKT